MAKLQLPSQIEKNDKSAEKEYNSGRSRLDRIIENSTIHIDAAACIRWSFLGAAILVLVFGSIFTGQTAEAAGAIIALVKP